MVASHAYRPAILSHLLQLSSIIGGDSAAEAI